MYGEVPRRQHPLTVRGLYVGHTHIREYITCQEQQHREYTINVLVSQGQKQSPATWYSSQEPMYQVSL